MDDKDTALTKAKIGILITGSKFLSTITFSLKHEWDNTINPPTANTKGKVIKYHPDFFMSLTPEERIFLIAHESWHVALNHLTRGSNKDFSIYNKAADYIINLMLVDAGFIMPKKDGKNIGLLDYQYKGMSTDQVYDLLKNNPNHQKNNSSSIMDGDIQPSASTEASEALEVDIKVILTKALTASKMAGEKPGTIPGDIEREINELINPKLPWQKLLARFLTQFTKEQYSWKKPNKRFFPDMILPSLHSNTLGHVAIANDTSGSLFKEEQTAIVTEITQIHRTYKPDKLTILDCDYKIHNTYTVGPSDKIQDLKFKGGGGTSFFPVFDYFKKDPPILLIYFTDLYAEQITEVPPYPVIWVCTSKHKPAYIGTTIYLE